MKFEVNFPGNKKVEAFYKGFHILSDQPKEAGGDSAAPSPFDLFFISIGNCAGFYVLEFCRERNIPAQDIKLEVGFEKNKESKMVEKVEINIKLPSNFPKKYKNAVIKAAEGCTVKKHLLNPPQIEIKTTS